MLLVNQLIQVLHVLFFRVAGVLEQKRVPGPVQVAIIVTAFGRAEDGKLNVIAAAGVVNGMERLVQVTDKVDDPFQRFQAVRARGFFIGKDFAENFNAIDNAIVVVSLRVLVVILRPEAVTLLRKAGGIFGDIDKVPVITLIAVSSDLVSPTGNGSKTVCAEQELEIFFSERRQARLGDIGDDGMAFGTPGYELGGDDGKEQKESDKLFHENPIVSNKSAAAEAAARLKARCN
jgi:hypothetical protein